MEYERIELQHVVDDIFERSDKVIFALLGEIAIIANDNSRKIDLTNISEIR